MSHASEPSRSRILYQSLPSGLRSSTASQLRRGLRTSVRLYDQWIVYESAPHTVNESRTTLSFIGTGTWHCQSVCLPGWLHRNLSPSPWCVTDWSQSKSETDKVARLQLKVAGLYFKTVIFLSKNRSGRPERLLQVGSCFTAVFFLFCVFFQRDISELR